MANTKALSKEERKKAKRTARKKQAKEAAARLRSRLQEAQSEEIGARHGQAVTGRWHSATWFCSEKHDGPKPRPLGAITAEWSQLLRQGCTRQSNLATSGVRPLASQLLAQESIDKLIADADEPGHRLKKTLGRGRSLRWASAPSSARESSSLPGTAAAGENFPAPSISACAGAGCLPELVSHGNLSGVLLHGRPPAGPAIAISFLLVAMACSFAGLCYAELASMIPIAGSAYTYSYATLGELFAWIIGWDLILEYVVSNVAVAVGFSGYLKAQLAAFGLTCRTTGRPRSGPGGIGPAPTSMCPVF